MAGNENSGRHGGKEDNDYKRGFRFNVPAWLDKEGKSYWKRNLTILVDNQCIGDKDFDAFCRLCDLYSKWRRCQAITNKDGSTYETTSDRGAIRIIKRPEAELELQYHKEMLNLERKFGLNPVDGKSAGFSKRGKKQSVRETYK